MAKDLEKAREIYWAHACNHFHIDREGMREKYREYGGAPHYEAEWRMEYIRRNVDLLKSDIKQGMMWLASAYAHEALPEVINFQNYQDDYEKFWYAFYLKDLANCAETSAEHKQFALEKSLNLWNEIIRSPKGIRAENRAKVTKRALEAFGASSAEEYLAKYSFRLLEGGEQTVTKSDTLTKSETFWSEVKKLVLNSRLVRSFRG